MEQDNWGRDPAVQQTRRIFAEMEQTQKTLLDHARLSPFDGRLGAVRETALKLFDKAVACAVSKGIRLTDDAMIGIYAVCLQQALSIAGIAISQNLLSEDSTLRELVCEVSR